MKWYEFVDEETRVKVAEPDGTVKEIKGFAYDTAKNELTVILK